MSSGSARSRPEWKGPLQGNAEIVKELDNLGRRMSLVQFEDGSTTFLFPDEVKTAGQPPADCC